MKTNPSRHICVHVTLLISTLFIGFAVLAQDSKKFTTSAYFANKETVTETDFLRTVINNETIMTGPFAVSGRTSLNSLSIIPLTEKNKYLIKVESGINEMASMVIVDKTGKIVQYAEVLLSTGENYLSTGRLDNLRPGNYQVFIKKKENIYSTSIIIK